MTCGPTFSSTTSTFAARSDPSFSSGFGSKLAWLVDHDKEIVFIGRDDADGRRAGKLALAVGVRNIAGLLAGGMTNWRQERLPADHTERLAVDGLAERIAADPAMQVLDVRERGEWDSGHIPGSVWTPWHDVAGIPEGLDRQRPIAVICAAGVRAATAASLLRHYGAEHVVHVVYGGVPRYGELGQPLERTPAVPPAPALAG